MGIDTPIDSSEIRHPAGGRKIVMEITHLQIYTTPCGPDKPLRCEPAHVWLLHFDQIRAKNFFKFLKW